MATFLRLLALVFALNIIRYLAAGPIEAFTVLPRLFAAMEASPSYFRNEFTTLDWITSYFYNFMMWASCVLCYHFIHPSLAGSSIVRSFKTFALLYLFFVSVSTIYMNHYSHPYDFYLYNILDGAIAFSVVALGNGLLYPRLMGRYAPRVQQAD